MVHHRFKRGYKNVINESIRLNAEGIESHLAIETSGHGAVKENYFLDDGEVTGWMLIRLSLHDPVIPTNFESDMEGGVEKIWGVAQSFLSKYEALSRA